MSEIVRSEMALIWKMYNLQDIPNLSWILEEQYPLFTPAASTTAVDVGKTVAENVTWVG